MKSLLSFSAVSAIFNADGPLLTQGHFGTRWSELLRMLDPHDPFESELSPLPMISTIAADAIRPGVFLVILLNVHPSVMARGVPAHQSNP